MGGKGDIGSGFKAYDYYGTIAAVLRAGPVDTIESLIIDSSIIWTGPINRTDPGMTNPYTISMPDGVVKEGGYVRLYWGDDTQTIPDPALAGHPPYRGMAYMVFKDLKFGQERTTAPNIEVIARAHARPPAAVIPATAPDTDGSYSVNPWAVLAELLTSIRGTALAPAGLDGASWQAAHDYFAATAARRLLTYCAPLLTDQVSLQSFCNDLTSLCDGGLSLKSDGTIEAFFYPVDPGDLSQYATLTDNDLTAPKKTKPGSWDSVPTGVVVKITDGDQWFIDWSLKHDDQRALRQAIEPRQETVQAPFIVRKTQALQLAAEWAKRKCQPQLTGSVSVRPERAVNLDATPLRVGNRFLLDIAPEPGGEALLQLCRVSQRKFKPTGPVTIDFEAEVNQPAVPSTTTYTPPTVEEITVAALSRSRIIPIPLSFDGKPDIGVLASRGDDLTVGAHVLFDVDAGAGVFTALGIQTGFAVPCQLTNSYPSASTDPIRLTILDSRDELIALAQPDASGAQNDQLLVVLYKTTIDDYIDENADGTPRLEWFSIQSSAVVSAGIYDFTVLRARLGSVTADWDSGDLAWIIPRASLEAFFHANFPSYALAHSDLVFRLNPFSKFSEFDGTPVNLPFRFPTSWELVPKIVWATPAGFSSTLAGTGDLTPAAAITDPDGNTVRVSLYYLRVDTGIQTKIFEVLIPPTGSITLADCFALSNVATPLNFPGDPVNDVYYLLTLRVQDAAGNVTESSRSLLRGATGGGGSGFVPPIINPGSTGFSNLLAITVDCSAPATQMQFAAASYGGALPGAGSWVTFVGTHFAGNVYQTERVWMRAGDGVNWSAWVFADYAKF